MYKSERTVNCLLTLDFNHGNIFLAGCYCFDESTGKYSGAIEILSVCSTNLIKPFFVLELPDYGVFDLNLLFHEDPNTKGNSCLVSTPIFFNAQCESSSARSGVVAPCTDGHLRIFSFTFESEVLLRVEVLLDVNLSKTMLTSAIVFQAAADSKMLLTVATSHGGQCHVAEIVVLPERRDFVLKETSLSASSTPVFDTNISYLETWEGHAYDAWCVAQDSNHAHIIFTGGDDGLIKCWDLRPVLSRSGDMRPALVASALYGAGIVSILPLVIGSKKFLLIGSYDEEARLICLPDEQDDQKEMKKALSKPVAQLHCGGGVWRVRPFATSISHSILKSPVVSLQGNEHFFIAALMQRGVIEFKIVITADAVEMVKQCYAHEGDESSDPLVYDVCIVDHGGQSLFAACSFYEKSVRLFSFSKH